MAVGRLQAALASATNEVTVAAANINFDFTVIRYDAPKEFQPLGQVLSMKRKQDAETGSSHFTARKLGALFEGICPPTPNLIKAYGNRVSGISKSATDKASSKYAASVFSAYTGVDGTSIWAAATSAKAALHVHLLACMLARFWEPNETVSVWVELVKERKEDIAKKLDNGESIPFALANVGAHVEISRSELGDWDASARSWLRTADRIKEFNQNQLQLLLKNINLPINQNTAVFTSVINVWKSALETMEKLISGMPQAVDDGATILGLSAWHLYPDLVVFGSHKSTEVHMHDELVAVGGVLSLGLQQPTTNPSKGVYWCLSLAHLRHYGRPVRTERALHDRFERMSFLQLVQASLGAILGFWRVPIEQNTSSIRFILEIAELLQEKTPLNISIPWCSLVAFAASEYLNAKGEEEQTALQAIHLGRRRSLKFLTFTESYFRPSNRGRYFGLENTALLLRKLKGPEERIAFLRRIALRTENLEKEDVILRIYYGDEVRFYSVFPKSDGTFEDPHVSVLFSAQEIQATKPDNDQATRRNSDQASTSGVEQATEPNNDQENKLNDDQVSNRHDDQGPGATKDHNNEVDATDEAINATLSDHPDGAIRSGQPGAMEDVGRTVEAVDEAVKATPSDPSDLAARFGNLLKRTETNDDMDSETEGPRLRVLSNTFTAQDQQVFTLLFGDNKHGQILLNKRGESSQTHLNHPPKIFEDDILWCLEEKLFSAEAFQELFKDAEASDPAKPILELFQALAIASNVYNLLPEATISTGVFNQPLSETKWFEATRSYGQITRACAMAIVLYFESGFCNLTLDQLSDVFAISSGDSLYVPIQMLCDPYDIPHNYELKQILGNIGKPGIVMLTSPQDPMIREIDPKKWRIANYAHFDGKPENCFPGTSIHLSFTSYHVPIYESRARGDHDTQISMLEVVTSVYDSGVWVADIDVLKAMDNVYRLQPPPPCEHPIGAEPETSCLSVACWDEVLDCPDAICVVKSSGNWLARLAILSVLAQVSKERERLTTICPESVCWRCLMQKSPRHVYIS